MKKQLLPLLLTTALFAACRKDDDRPVIVTPQPKFACAPNDSNYQVNTKPAFDDWEQKLFPEIKAADFNQPITYTGTTSVSYNYNPVSGIGSLQLDFADVDPLVYEAVVVDTGGTVVENRSIFGQSVTMNLTGGPGYPIAPGKCYRMYLIVYPQSTKKTVLQAIVPLRIGS